MTLYDFFGYFGAVVLLGHNFSTLKVQKNALGSRSRWLMKRCMENPRGRKWLCTPAFWACVEIMIISVFQYGPAAVLHAPFGEMVGTGANYFGSLYPVPLFLLAGCFVLGTDPLTQIDRVTPAFPLALACSKIGCFFAGCCGGIAINLAPLNLPHVTLAFPTQLLESILALLIFFLLQIWKDVLPDGTMFPVYLILYSGIRFFSEFLRHEENVFGILKTYHLLCIGGVVLGLLELFLVLKFGGKLRALFGKSAADQ